jgi:hypothetical protein
VPPRGYIGVSQHNLGQVKWEHLHFLSTFSVYNLDVDILTVGNLDVEKRA